jgi:hypothetical protein
MASRTVQLTVDRPWREVCEFLAEPRNYPLWASWLGPSLRRQDGAWILARPDGRRAKVRFTERNAFGVADHWVLEAEDRAALIALRTVPNGGGCEVVLTLLAESGSLGPHANAAQHDLGVLKTLLEQRRTRW